MKTHTQTKLRLDRRTLFGTAVALAVGGAAHAQQTETVDLASWDPGSIEGAWSADQLTDLEVRDATGESIGEVESIIVGADDKVAAIVLETGGFLDIGDTHFRVSWDDVSVDPSGELGYVSVPIDADNYDQFSLFGDGGDVETTEREWRVTELIGDYVSLGEGVTSGYGYVNDILFGADGSVEAVVVNRDSALGSGYYAYPYYGYDHGFDPGLDTYPLPYADDDLVDYEPFDYTPYAG